MFKRRSFQSLLFALCLISAGCSSNANRSENIVNQAAVQFTSPTSNPTINLGQSVNLQATASGGQGVTWSLQNGSGNAKPPGQLTNQTSTSATYVAPPLTNPPSCNVQSPPPSPQQAVIVATSVSDPTQSADLPIVIVQSPPCVATMPSVTSFTAAGNQVFNVCPPSGTLLQAGASNPGAFQVGVFNQVLIYDGGSQVLPLAAPYGVPPFTWSVSAGTLPDGISLGAGPNSSIAALNGTPVSAGCSSFSLQITDASGISVSQPFFLVVVPPSLKSQVPNLPNAYVDTTQNKGVPYPPQTLSVSGGIPPYSWNYNPNPSAPPGFPPGICLASSQSDVPTGCVNGTVPAASNFGVISGTPSPTALAFGLTTQYTVELQVNDSSLPYPALGLINPTMTANVQQAFCTAAQPIQPFPGLNGGVTGGGSVPANFYLQGSMAFLARGFDATGPVVMAGSVNFSSDGSGNILGGEMDVTRSGGSHNLSILPTGSSFTVGVTEDAQVSYNRGCMTLADSSGGKTTFAFTLAACSNQYSENGITTTGDNACGMKQNSQQQNIAAGFFTTGHLIEFDDTTGSGTRVAGILRLQDPNSFSAGLSGPYAFGIGGRSAQGRFAAAGSFHASSGTLSSLAEDYDNAGTLGTNLTGGSGTYSVSANGRGTVTLTSGSTSVDMAFYMVASNEVILATTDPLDATHPVAGGEAISGASSFSDASLQNSHIFHLAGVAPGCNVLSSGCPDVSVGVLLFDGAGDLTGTVFENQSGTLGTSPMSGFYSIDASTGRTAFSAPINGQLGSHPFVAYVIPLPASLTRTSCSSPASCVSGFLVGTDNTAQAGALEFQTSVTSPPPPFTSSYIVGDFAYGTDESLDALTSNLEGDSNASPSTSSVTAGVFNSLLQDVSFADPNYCSQPGCPLLVPNELLGGSFAINSNGTGNFGGGTVSVTNGRVVFYVDESPQNLHPTIVVAEQ